MARKKPALNVRGILGPGFGLILSLWPGRCPAGDWPKYCGNIEMTGRSDSPEMGKSTIGKLALLWQIKLSGPIASSPSVWRSTLYVGDWSGSEWAINAETGAVIAFTNLGQTAAPQCNPPLLGITSAAAVFRDAIFVAGGDDSFYALDAHTLETRWRRPLGDHSSAGGYYGWSSPSVVGNRVLQGVSSNCDNPFVPGALVAMDTSTGEIVSRAELVSDGELGGGVWTSPSVDIESRSVFVTTASALDWNDLHAYSIVRLSLDGLRILDSWKLNPVLVSDADWGSSPTLFTDRNGRRLVGAGEKDGSYYAFDRMSLAGGPIWKTAIADGGDCPQCDVGTLSTASYDGVRLYVGGGRPPGASEGGARSSVVALDPADGRIIWRKDLPSGPILAPVSSANGIVFAVAGGVAVALDAEDGALLWSFDTGSFGDGGIAIAGRRLFFGDLSGNLYAFAVPPRKPEPRSAVRSQRLR